MGKGCLKCHTKVRITFSETYSATQSSSYLFDLSRQESSNAHRAAVQSFFTPFEPMIIIKKFIYAVERVQTYKKILRTTKELPKRRQHCFPPLFWIGCLVLLLLLLLLVLVFCLFVCLFVFSDFLSSHC